MTARPALRGALDRVIPWVATALLLAAFCLYAIGGVLR